jgi:nitrogen-specific signal transduction histidine kinase
MDLSSKTTSKIFLTFIVFAFIIASTSVIINSVMFADKQQKLALENATKKIKEREAIFQTFIKNIDNTLIAVRENSTFIKYINNQTDIKDIEKIFLTISKSNAHIMQLRYLDKKGIEKIRVDRKNFDTKPFIVSKNKLQDKSHRYYFTNSKLINKEKIWYSKIDLNIENKKVEIPHKPTIRAMLPIYNNGVFDGVVVINFFMEKFLDNFINTPLYHMILFDKDGYVLRDSENMYNWSFYNKNNYKIFDTHKDLSSHLYSDKLYKTDQYIVGKIDIKADHDLYLMFKLKSKYIQQQNDQELKENITVSLITFLISLILAYFIVDKFSYVLEKLKDKTKKLKDKNRLVNDILNAQSNFTIVTDGSEITMANKTMLDFFGYYNISEFKKNHECICDFFIQEDGYLQKDIDGKNWLDVLLDNKDTTHKVKMADKNNEEKIFLVSTKGITLDEKHHFIIIFNDVTNLEKLNIDKINREKVAAKQEKMASMGSMIGNITHQWRQPLNTIVAIVNSIEVKKMLDKLNDEYLLKSLEEIKEHTMYLSDTINTFRDFLKEKKRYQKVILQDRIDIATKVVYTSLKDNHIELKKDIDYNYVIETHLVVGELIEVIINIINNSKDALVEKNIENAWVKVSLYEKNSNAIITIEDNAGGIPADVMPHIFDEYFTTKDEEHGTGLGLHMSYRIITESLGGKIYA